MLESGVSDADVRRFVKAVDSDGDEMVSFPDFLVILLPQTDEILRRDMLNRINTAELSLDAYLASLRLLETYITALKSIENDQYSLIQQAEVNLMDAFRLIDPSNATYATANTLQAFLSSLNTPDLELNIEALMRVLDADKDGRVGYLEFLDGVLPRDVGYRSAATGIGEYMTPTRPKQRPISNSTPGKRIKSPIPSEKKRIVRSRTASPSQKPAKTPVKLKQKARIRHLSKVFEEPLVVRRALFPGKADLPALAEVLIQQLNWAKAVEELRETLALRLDFTLSALFNSLDPPGLGYIPLSKLHFRLNQYHLNLNNDHFSLLSKALDRDKDDKVLFSDLAAVIVPKGKEYRTVLTERDEFSRKKMAKGTFSLETFNIIRELLLATVGNEVNVEKLRQNIVHEDLFSLSKAVNVLDSRSKGFLTEADFRRFLRSHGKYVTEGELESIMQRYDRDQDGRVSYEEFIEELTPKAPKGI